MKGMFRLTLSSYAMITVASAPALALQESSLVSTRVSLASPVADRPDPSATVASTRRSVDAVPVRLPHASSAAADTLAVVVQGPSEVHSAAASGFRAAVVNGANGSRYYFWWFAARCARRIGCAPSSYTLIAEGPGRDLVALRISGGDAEKDLVVQVAEMDGTGRTGSSPMFVVAGPAQRDAGAPKASGRLSCDWFAGSFYPHTGDYTDPYTGQSWPRKFRRDYCGNRVQWDPEG